MRPLPRILQICQSRPNAVRAAAQAVCQLYRDRAGVLDAVSRVLSLLVQAAGSDRALAKAQADLQVRRADAAWRRGGWAVSPEHG